MKVAVVGLSPTTHHLAPWRDASWEKWGLPWDSEAAVSVMSRCFEMHDWRLLTGPHSKRKPSYFDLLRDLPRLYLQAEQAEIPNAEAYPFERVASVIGRPYWNSSISYAMALAIAEGAEEIGIWGVDMAGDDEYGYQRPNMEWLVGVAEGRGIKVHIPEASPLCKYQHGAKFYNHVPHYAGRYGWLG